MLAKQSRLKTVLLIAERDGQRCAGPMLIAGIAIGVGVIQLSTGTLKESSLMSLQMLSLLVLELMGPLLVSAWNGSASPSLDRPSGRNRSPCLAPIRSGSCLDRHCADNDVFQCISVGRHPGHPQQRNGGGAVGDLGKNKF